jgi:hypothetical protein
MILAHRVCEFETENFGVEFDGRFGIFAAERGVMQLFAEHGVLPDLAFSNRLP